MEARKLFLSCAIAAMTYGSANAQQFDEMVYSPTATTFKLFAPNDAKTVKVRLYGKGDGGKAAKTVKMKRTGDSQWTAVVPGDHKNKFYTFDTGRGESAGIFARAVGVNGKRGAIIDLNDTDPTGWENDVRPVVKSPVDLVIYEMHHRDFSIARNINIDAGTPADIKTKRTSTKYPGKYLALTEDWSINYLKSLGVNAIHILPSFDYASVDETKLDTPQYNWGYDPVNYNVPEGSYSTDPYNPHVRILEFKKMVQALHKAGIRVILDVVYNHTFDINGSNFQRTYPDYFYRKTADGKYSDGSGCGNETASEREMMRRFIVESVKYWIDEYHIDGFRFDLMGIHDIETMNLVRAAVNEIDPTIFIYGEGWSAGTCAYPQDKLGMKANISMMPGIAAFSDEMRDALRGPFSDDTKGQFLAGIAGGEESIKFGIAGAVEHPQVDCSKVNYSKKPWALEPSQMISYVSCHDDMCLVDRLRASVPGIKDDELIRLDLLAQTAVFTSQGVPFILCGEEMLRDKKGVHNSYNSPDSINRLNWNNPVRYSNVLDYYSKLIALRNNHPAFRLGSADLVRKHLEFLPSQDALVAFRLKNYAGRDDWRNIIVVLNANREARTVDIPEGKYTVVCRDGKIDENGLGTVNGAKVSVAPQSALIIHD